MTPTSVVNSGSGVLGIVSVILSPKQQIKDQHDHQNAEDADAASAADIEAAASEYEQQYDYQQDQARFGLRVTARYAAASA